MHRNCSSFLVLIIAFNSFLSANAQQLIDQKTKTIKIKELTFVQVDGFIKVPESRTGSSTKTIKLPVRILKTPNKAPLEPVFYLDGGPGYSNLGGSSDTQLLQHRDFVFVGYRGADGEIVLRSKKMYKAIKGKNNKLLSDESLNGIEAATKIYLAELKMKEIDISQYTIPQVVEDIEEARKTLGYKKINLLSFSYGTRVALLYSYRYPESIKRIVMSGANPPGHFLWYPEKTEQILNTWDSIYRANGKGSLKENMKKALDNMPKKWTIYKLDKDKIKTITFGLMSTNDLSVMAFDCYYRAAQKKDYSGLYLLQFMFDVFMKKIIWGEMFAKGASADWQPNVNYRKMLRQSETTTLLGPNQSLLLWGSLSQWDKTLIPEEYRELQTVQKETLLVSGSLDVNTPTDFAREKLLPHLAKGQQVILENFSHGDIPMIQEQNYFRLVNSFFDSGKIDTSGYTPHQVDLKPKKRLYKLAKLGFPVIVVMKWFQ